LIDLFIFNITLSILDSVALLLGTGVAMERSIGFHVLSI